MSKLWKYRNKWHSKKKSVVTDYLNFGSFVMLEPTPKPVNLTNELAKERNRAAAERTLMAWIRTCLSLISFGVGIDRIVNALHQGLGEKINSTGISRFLGLSFIALGVFGLCTAIVDHREQLRLIQRDDYHYAHRGSQSLTVAAILSILGAFAFLSILFNPYPNI